MNIIKYIDFNNNVYTISEFSIQYYPMEPKYSSYGEYSEGEAREQDINEDVYKEIKKIAWRIIRNKSIHVSKRRMLTVVVSMKNDEEYLKCIIPRGNDQRELEKVINTYLL